MQNIKREKRFFSSFCSSTRRKSIKNIHTNSSKDHGLVCTSEMRLKWVACRRISCCWNYEMEHARSKMQNENVQRVLILISVACGAGMCHIWIPLNCWLLIRISFERPFYARWKSTAFALECCTECVLWLRLNFNIQVALKRAYQSCKDTNISN